MSLFRGTGCDCGHGTRKTPVPRCAMARKRTSRKPRRWSARVTRTSNALDLEPGVFRRSARGVALSLKRSAERSGRRKTDPYRSALSMLTFYINRAGKNLSADRKRTLMQAKRELRKVFHRE
jgi:Protein of unknown function (DUF3175)